MTDDIASPRDFDHTDIAHLPEYHAVRKALDDLAKAVGRADIDMSQQAFVEAAGDMARTGYAADDCDCCGLSSNTLDPAWPHQAIVEGEDMKGAYRCPRTGRTWTCSYTTNSELLAHYFTS